MSDNQNQGGFYDTGWRPSRHVHRDEEGRPHDHPGIQEDTGLGVRASRALAIHELLVDKGVIGEREVDEMMESWSERVPANGSTLVAKAWSDPEFKKQLLKNPKETVIESGFVPEHNADIVVLENTDAVHYMVVCTLCSCYPTALLGPPPDWYKSFSYRSRAVTEPRQVMSEFGLELEDETEVRVVDSNSELRFLVIPRRPEQTEGWSVKQLAELVNRNSMIGVASATKPGAK